MNIQYYLIFCMKQFLFQRAWISRQNLLLNSQSCKYILRIFGEKDDWCLVAEIKGKIVGAVWVRIMNDYGHIDNETPSFAISLYEEYRNMGIGTALMRDMLELLKKKGYEQTSLSVQKANYAVGMYRKVGFEVIDENEAEYIMVCRL